MKRLMMGLVAVLISTAAMAAVDVNSATQAQLEDVKGLGPVKARRLLTIARKTGRSKPWMIWTRWKGSGGRVSTSSGPN